MQIDSSNSDIYSILNSLNSQYQDLATEYTNATGSTKTSSTSSDSDSDGDTDTERETYGVSLLEYMDDTSYDSFTRATEGLDDSVKQRFATALQIFTSTYSNATNAGINNTQTLLSADNEDDSDIGNLLGSSTLLKVAQFSMTEGSDILQKMATGSGESMQDLMGRLASALQSGSGINYSG